MAAWYIRTRAEFFDVLARTLEFARRRRQSSPFWAHASIESQLQAMTEWTAAGRTPTGEERRRITIGLIAIREFDSQPESEEAYFIECLLQLPATSTDGHPTLPRSPPRIAQRASWKRACNC